MSILQDYERFKEMIGEREWELITMFLDSHGEYFLSDLMYKQDVYKLYEEWKKDK
jgi:hypothetical protein